MIWVIDTSTKPWEWAVLEDSGRPVGRQSGNGPPPLAGFYRVHLAGRLSRVGVATGPGSFTGTRVGVSFGLGLAIGLGVPIVPLPSLELQAARSDDPVTAVADAGRGRVYFKPPGGAPALGEPADVPTAYPLVGWARADPLLETGHVFRPEGQLRS